MKFLLEIEDKDLPEHLQHITLEEQITELSLNLLDAAFLHHSDEKAWSTELGVYSLEHKEEPQIWMDFINKLSFRIIDDGVLSIR